jgi:transcriptional regulator with XRE-family HTH domain
MRYIGAVERGEINISLDNLERIARTLRTQLSRLFAEAEQGR